MHGGDRKATLKSKLETLNCKCQMSMMSVALPRELWLVFAIGGFLAIAYVCACVFLYLRQTRFIFFPSPEIETTPAQLDLEYEDVWLPVQVAQGKEERLHGWWIPAAASPATGVLLYLHGNGVNIGANLNHAHRFHQLGFSVLLIDYRGYGHSEGGFPSESRVYQDAERAWDYLTRERGVPSKQIFLYGMSLGGAIAIELAIRHPEAAGLMVQSSFTSMREMVNYRYHFWMFPVDLLLTEQFDSLTKVKNLQMPVLFMHGTDDADVPVEMSQQLFDRAPEPKQLFIVPTARHHNVAAVSGERYFQQVREFVAAVEKHTAAPRLS